MMSDVIWATVCVYTVGAAVWLVYYIINQKGLESLTEKNDGVLLQHHSRIELLEKGLLNTQNEFLATRDAVTRIENRLADAPPAKASRRWPGGE